MQKDVTMYVRNKKNTPIGVMYFQPTGICALGDIPVVALGWSKANKLDVFIKKFGRVIASKRADKAHKWACDSWSVQDYLGIVNINDSYLDDQTTTVPYAIADNLGYYLTKAKECLGIEGDTVFILPIIDKFVDITTALMDSIRSDSLDINMTGMRKAKSTNRTRYIPIIL